MKSEVHNSINPESKVRIDSHIDKVGVACSMSKAKFLAKHGRTISISQEIKVKVKFYQEC